MVECVICADSIININCDICHNGICDNCFIRLVDRNKDSFKHKCPFCKSYNLKKWVDIDIPVIIKIFEKQEDTLLKDFSVLHNKLCDKDDEIERLKSIIKQNNKEIKKNNEFIAEQTNIINNTLMNLTIKSTEDKKKMSYQRFYKITYWGLRESDIEISAKDAMCRVRELWSEYKKSFESTTSSTT